MFGVLLLLFLVVPIIEIYVLVQVAQGIGTFPAIGLMILISFFGAWLVRREGFAIFTRIRDRLFGGEIPSTEIADGALIMLGGSLLLTPGFLTDALGLGLLIPPIRAVVRNIILKRVEVRRAAMANDMAAQVRTFGFDVSGRGPGGRVVDVESVDISRRDGERPVDDFDLPVLDVSDDSPFEPPADDR